jgi:RND family efflux transporter MFP subunit
MMVRTENQIRWTLVALAVVATGCASAAGDSEEMQSQGDSLETAAAEDFARIVNVTARTVEPTEFIEHIRITGQAEAYYDITISAEEGGAITEFFVEKGDPVSRGQVIAHIDDRALTAQVNEARASAALAQEQFERQRRLWEDERMGTEIVFLQAKYQAEISQARLENLEVRLAKTDIKAPVDGVFDARFIEMGEIALPGAQVGRVVSVSRIKITGGVPERYAASVARGERAIVAFDILPGREFTGTINFVGRSVDEQSRTFPIEIVLSNPGGVVKPRMVANVQLVRTSLQGVIVASLDVVRRSESGYHVFLVVERNGRLFAEARPVTLGATSGNAVVIEQGVERGDRLITLGSQLVDDGSRVRVVDDPSHARSEG